MPWLFLLLKCFHSLLAILAFGFNAIYALRGALLSTKLSPPRLPIWLVERSHLLSELEAVRAHSLTLVSATAGSGKTTLLSAWVTSSLQFVTSPGGLQGDESALAWLSLDELDNEPTRFWASVIAALRTCLPELGEETLAMLRMPQPPPFSTLLMVLLNEISEGSRDIILILDDYQVIADPIIGTSMLFLLDHLPMNMHLVLATRTDPALPLSRLRVRGQLMEIRNQDLRFTRGETASFLLQRMGLSLSEEDVTMLQTRTEGWIAGLQLAAHSLRKQHDLRAWVSDFAGSHRYLLDYVQQDILARLPVSLQHFLLQTSILTRMNAALCQATTVLPTQEGCQEMLFELERANLFVVPLDELRQWYRYHELFREALQARLQASQPAMVPLLHQRAARWYGMAGDLQEAIVHALSAPDYPLAACLMEQAAPAFWLRGEARTIHIWVLSLPDTVLRAYTPLALDATLRLLNPVHISAETVHADTRAQVERTFSRMEEFLRRKLALSLSEAEVALIERRMRLLHGLIEARAVLKRGDTEHLRHLVQELEALPKDAEVSWNLIPLSFTCWLTVVLQGEGAFLLSRLLATKQQAMQAGDHLATTQVMTWLAFTYRQAGQLHRAQQECLQALALVEQVGGHTTMAGYLYGILFDISYAWNRLRKAADWLDRLRRLAHDWQQVELLVLGEKALVQLSLARGDLSTAHQAAQRVEALVEREGYAHHTTWMAAMHVEYCLAQGNLAQASRWVAQTAVHPDAWDPLRKEEVLMRVRISLAQQQYVRALELLSSFSRHLDRPGDIETTVNFLTLYVVALHHAGKREQAAYVAARLLKLTGPEGYIRVYLDAGEPMKQVLQTLLAQTRKGSLDAPQDEQDPKEEFCISQSSLLPVLSAFRREERQQAQRVGANAFGIQTLQTEPTEVEVQRAPAEPLSPQEFKVLRLLVRGQTYPEMAQALIVSPNTIKTQVRSIYRKLGVSRRAEAIAVVARLHLL